MATYQKKARRKGAYLALTDESGLHLAPLLRRSWAPRGQTPILRQRARHRDKVSIAATLWLNPRRDRLGLFFRTLVNGYFNNERSAAYLDELLCQWQEPVMVLWDGGNMHKGDPINTCVAESQGRLLLERLPPYGAELMPVEQLWSWLKHSRLSNFAAADAYELNDVAVRELTAIGQDQDRLQSFVHASALPLPRTLFF